MLAYPHPAFLFVSACMFCDRSSMKADSLENGAVGWFDRIQPGSEAATLPYKPRYYDRHLLGIARIQRDFWKKLTIDLFQKLGTPDEDIRWFEDQAVFQSAIMLDDRLHDLGVISPGTDQDPSTWTTIVHLNSLLSSDDLRAAEPQWLAEVRQKTNAASLDTCIREVAQEGYSQREIANMFGISVGTVNKALNPGPESVQKPDDN